MDLPEGVSPVERLLAHDEIQQLANRYAVAVGARAFDVLAELLVEDIVASPGGGGGDAPPGVHGGTLGPERQSWLTLADGETSTTRCCVSPLHPRAAR